MKFWQRQIVLSVGLLFVLLFLLLHFKNPDDVVYSAASQDSNLYGRVPTGEDPSAPRHGRPHAAPTTARPHPRDKDPLAESHVQRTAGSECVHVLRPVHVRDRQTFQAVDQARDVFVFSAFLDPEQRLVRVVGLATRKARGATCLLWYRQGRQELRVVSGAIKLLPEGHNRRYSAAYVHCNLPSDDTPDAITVTMKDCRHGNRTQSDVSKPPSNALPVLVGGSLERNFTVCVTPLNYRYSRAYELVEMLELNRLLGADLFTFYVQSVGENVRAVLKWYEQQGVVRLIDWDIPVQVDHWPPNKAMPPEIHYFAQLASHNDCLNRHRGSSRYLVYQDLDEFIVPKRHGTWGQMMAAFPRPAPAYLFRCVFFRKDWPRNTEDFPGREAAQRFRSVVLSTDKREPAPFPHAQRAKYMVDPRAIQTTGIHNIWAFRGAMHVMQVKERDALLHHYRDWENPRDAGRAVRDTDIHRYRHQLLARLTQRWRQLPNVSLDIPLVQYGQV